MLYPFRPQQNFVLPAGDDGAPLGDYFTKNRNYLATLYPFRPQQNFVLPAGDDGAPLGDYSLLRNS